MFDTDAPYIKELYNGQEKELTSLKTWFLKDSKHEYSSKNSHLLFYIDPSENIIRLLKYCNNFEEAESRIINVRVNGKDVSANDYIIITKEFAILGFICDGYLSIEICGNMFDTFVEQNEDGDYESLLEQEKLQLNFYFNANDDNDCLTKLANILKKSLDSIVSIAKDVNNADIVKNPCIEDSRRKCIGIAQVSIIDIIIGIIKSNALMKNLDFIDSSDYFCDPQDYDGFHLNVKCKDGRKFEIIIMSNIDREFLLFTIEEIGRKEGVLVPVEIMSQTNDKNSKWLTDMFFSDLKEILNNYGNKFKIDASSD